MKNLTKLVAIGVVGLMMTACSSTYKIKSEKGKVMNSDFFIAEALLRRQINDEK